MSGRPPTRSAGSPPVRTPPGRAACPGGPPARAARTASRTATATPGPIRSCRALSAARRAGRSARSWPARMSTSVMDASARRRRCSAPAARPPPAPPPWPGWIPTRRGSGAASAASPSTGSPGWPPPVTRASAPSASNCATRDLRRGASLRALASRSGAGRRHHGGYSHSMVPGGLLVMSTTTRLIWGTSLVIRVEMAASSASGSRAQSAVMASSLVTGRSTTGWP